MLVIRDLIKSFFLIIILILVNVSAAYGDHQIGGDFFYKCLGPGTSIGTNTYEFTFISYEACNNVSTSTIVEVNIAEEDFFAVRSFHIERDTLIYFRPESNLPCVVPPDGGCYEKRIYRGVYSLPIIDKSYYAYTTDCCRTEALINIYDSAVTGNLFYVELPSFAQEFCNSNPVFNDEILPEFCVGEAFNLYQSATDAEGDQIIYKFCTPLGFDPSMLQSPIYHPPYPEVTFILPTYSTLSPLGPGGFSINPSTGLLTGVPSIVGSFAVGICLEEYRNGMYLGETRRDIAINVVACTPLLTADLEAETTDPQNRAVYQLCNENTLTIQNLSGPSESITDHEWYIDYPDQPLTSNLETPTFTFDQPGVFYGHLVVNPDSICNDTAFFVVQLSDLDTDFFTNYDTCNIGPVAFVAMPNSSATVSEYHWNFGDSLTALEENPMHQFPAAGAYEVQLIVTDEYGCNDTLQESLTWQPAPEVIVVSPDIAVGCAPLVTTIQNYSQPVDTTYQLYWEFGDGGTDTGLSTTNTYDTPGSYNVYLSITSPYGCFVDTVFEDLIFADLPPKAEFTWSPSTDPEKFAQIQFMDASERALGWNWIFDTLLVPDIRREPFYIFPDTGYHDVVLMVEDQYGCFDTLTQGVDVVPPQTYFLPNAFTPNGDGLNDEFIGVGLTDYLQDFKMDVFDRWGGLVFSSTDVRRGWDGGSAPAGVYVYMVRYRVPRGEQTKLRGEVVLVR